MARIQQICRFLGIPQGEGVSRGWERCSAGFPIILRLIQRKEQIRKLYEAVPRYDLQEVYDRSTHQ